MLLNHHVLLFKAKIQEVIFMDHFFMLITTVYVIVSVKPVLENNFFAVTNLLTP